MTILNPDYEFQIEEGVVYKIAPTNIFNVAPLIHITGTGTVDLHGSIQTPTATDDPILTLEASDTNIFGFYQFNETMPNYIILQPNQSGSRVITLKGFAPPIPLTF